MSKTNLRICYLITSTPLLIIEVLIALFVHDNFIRPYIGDMLVVIVIYTFVRILIPRGCRLLPLWVFMFAAGVEVSQYFNIVEILSVQNNTFLRVLIGSVFDIKDILCYSCGCILLGVCEYLIWKLPRK